MSTTCPVRGSRQIFTKDPLLPKQTRGSKFGPASSVSSSAASYRPSRLFGTPFLNRSTSQPLGMPVGSEKVTISKWGQRSCVLAALVLCIYFPSFRAHRTSNRPTIRVQIQRCSLHYHI